MKKSILIAALGLFSLSTMAQDAKPEEGFVFTTVKENPITSIKNQNRSSTCWSFSTLGFVESELLRLGKGEYDLAEMFVVHKTMQDRGANYVRYHGDSSFSPGGSFYDIMYCLKNYGLVPQKPCRASCTVIHYQYTMNWTLWPKHIQMPLPKVNLLS